MRHAHREPGTRREGSSSGMRRYRCVATGCGWQGLLPRLPRTHERSGLTAARRRWRQWAWPALALTALGLAAAAVVGQQLMEPPSAAQVPPGKSHYGQALVDSHPLQVRHDTLLVAYQPGKPLPGLTLRQHCAWGKPGGNPYRGSVTEALQSAGLPAEVVSQISQQVEQGQASERLTIANDGIRGDRTGRLFSPGGMAMTYGRTLCLGTYVNFAPGHTEPASLYEATDAQGRRHTVMVPDVCGNVTMISEGERGREKIKLTGGRSDLTWLIDTPDAPRRQSSGGTHAVPEPGTLWGVGTGLVLLAWLRRRVTSSPERP